MKTIKVPDMMCENCVKRITNALAAAELKFQVDLAEKKVTIDGWRKLRENRRQRVGGSGFYPGGSGLKPDRENSAQREVPASFRTPGLEAVDKVVGFPQR